MYVTIDKYNTRVNVNVIVELTKFCESYQLTCEFCFLDGDFLDKHMAFLLSNMIPDNPHLQTLYKPLYIVKIHNEALCNPLYFAPLCELGSIVPKYFALFRYPGLFLPLWVENKLLGPEPVSSLPNKFSYEIIDRFQDYIRGYFFDTPIGRWFFDEKA